MNVFLFEMKRELKHCFLWLLGLISIQAIFLLGMYQIFMDSKINMTAVLNQFPEAMRKAFAFEIANFYEFQSFYSFGMLYVSLIAIIMSLSLSISVFSREKRAKCTDFILTKPMKRERLFFIKTSVVFIELCVNHVIFLVCSILFYKSLKLEEWDLKGFVMATFGVFFLELVFLFLGAACSMFFKKIRTVSGTAVTIGFSVFILNAIINLLEKKSLSFLAFLKYFDTNYIMTNHKWQLDSLVFCLLFGLAFFIPAYLYFVKSQIKALN